MAKQRHKVWEVRVASLDDEKPRDRRYEGGRRWVMIAKLPERAVYLIEAKGQGARATKKALSLAVDEGIPRPVVLSIEWANCPFLGPCCEE
jgi:hypothetical protein